VTAVDKYVSLGPPAMMAFEPLRASFRSMDVGGMPCPATSESTHLSAE
jgi:hypothetical protein